MTMYFHIINIGLTFVVALVLHEMGHFLAARACHIPITQAGFGWGPKVGSLRLGEVEYVLRLLPLGAYIRMDMASLQRRRLIQQLFILLAGVAVNFVLSFLTWGTMFGAFNLALAIGNLLPLYQQDGWKIGMVICRRAFGRPNPFVEWSFTISGVLIGFAVLMRALLSV
ncbi:MAG TPA: site-2 protease family protein [Pyrinomonadaceae bacterium]|nr:site-2 protease family protein [Pyrinomonadaceae bacterium]